MPFRDMLVIAIVCTITCAVSAAHAGTPLELSACRINAGPAFPGIKARCGTMLRPENPADPASPKIEIRVAVVPALNLQPEPDPLVPLAGGPGQGAIQFYSAYSEAFEPVRRNRDILLVDQRGTGSSSRMDCPIDDDFVEGRYSKEQTLAFTRACLAELPHDPRYFTTSVAITDLEAVRIALGYPQLNLYGVSYGTRVAQHYARRYPEATRSIVLDGVLPPQLSLGPEIATEAQRALDAILKRCADDAACNERFPDIADAFARVKTALGDAAVAVELPNPITGLLESIDFGHGEFAAAIRLLAYHPNSIALVPLLVHEAANGNYRPLAAQFQMTLAIVNDSLALGMHNSIVCTEDVPFYKTGEIDYGEIEASYMGLFQLEALETICSAWPDGPIDADFKQPLATDIPALLLSGDADPITPPRYGELAMADFTRARHLVGKLQGHGQVPVGCMPKLLEQFITTADPGAIDAGCLERSFVMPFFLDYSGPQP